MNYTSKEHFTSRRGIKELDQAIDIDKKFGLKFDLEEYSVENLRLAVRGDNNNWNDQAYEVQTAGTSTNQAFTARQDRWVDLGKRSILASPAIVLKNSASVTMTEGYDYIIDHVSGRVKVTYDGRVYDKEACTITYSYSSVKQPKILTSEDTKVEGFCRFIGDQTYGPSLEVQVWKAKIWCTSGIQLISDDYSKLSFEGTIFSMYDSHPTEPFFKILNPKATTIIS
jgi:hypothetical protein